MSDGDTEKRSSNGGSPSMGDKSVLSKASTTGVGGRQKTGQGSPGGGRYQDICTTEGSGFTDAEAVTVRELRQMGMPRVWIEAANLLGPGPLILLWRHLDRSAQVEDEGNRLRLTLPRFSQYLRYQRNQYIQALAAEGRCAREIQETVARKLGKRLSRRHIERLMGGGG